MYVMFNYRWYLSYFFSLTLYSSLYVIIAVITDINVSLLQLAETEDNCGQTISEVGKVKTLQLSSLLEGTKQHAQHLGKTWVCREQCSHSSCCYLFYIAVGEYTVVRQLLTQREKIFLGLFWFSLLDIRACMRTLCLRFLCLCILLFAHFVFAHFVFTFSFILLFKDIYMGNNISN